MHEAGSSHQPLVFVIMKSIRSRAADGIFGINLALAYLQLFSAVWIAGSKLQRVSITHMCVAMYRRGLNVVTFESKDDRYTQALSGGKRQVRDIRCALHNVLQMLFLDW